MPISSFSCVPDLLQSKKTVPIIKPSLAKTPEVILTFALALLLVAGFAPKD